jgi:hypothetical protein
VESGLLLDVVVGQGTAILKLLAGENEALLIRWDTLLVLDLRLNVIDGIRRLNLEGDCLAGESLDEDLHTATETENQVESGLLLNVIIGKSTAVLELFACEDQALLVRGNAFLVLDFRLDIVDSVRGLDLKRDGLASKGLDKNWSTL